MKKVRVYVETSVINHLDAPDRPDWMAITRALWAEFETGKYEIVIGEPVIGELEECPEPKRELMFQELKQITYKSMKISDQAERLAEKYVTLGGLPKKSRLDALRHIRFSA